VGAEVSLHPHPRRLPSTVPSFSLEGLLERGVAVKVALLLRRPGPLPDGGAGPPPPFNFLLSKDVPEPPVLRPFSALGRHDVSKVRPPGVSTLFVGPPTPSRFVFWRHEPYAQLRSPRRWWIDPFFAGPPGDFSPHTMKAFPIDVFPPLPEYRVFRVGMKVSLPEDPLDALSAFPPTR